MSYANPYEQYMLELINAERAKVDVQPLAFNSYLNDAAEDHTAWMLATDSFSHTGDNGTTGKMRMQEAGYQFTNPWGWGENIALRSLRAPDGYVDDVDALHAGLMNSDSHRANILKASFKEVGIGFEVGEWRGFICGTVTQDFAYSGTGSFITGVAFDDKDGDRFYDIGEGLSGYTVVATSATGIEYTAKIQSAGGYGIKVFQDGFYQVQLMSGSTVLGIQNVSMSGGLNVKVDFVDPGAAPPQQIDPTPNKIIGTDFNDMLTGVADRINWIYGKKGNDILYAANHGDTLYGDGGDDRLFGGDGADFLYGGTGNDEIVGGAGNDMIFDSAGSNRINGGAGDDAVVYDRNFADVRIARYTDSIVVTGVGSNTIIGVETLRFANGAYDVATGTFLP